MGGLFGVAGTGEIVEDLFFGTDYHSHLGTNRGGLAAGNGATLTRYIGGPSSNTRRPGPAASCPRTRRSATRWRG
jgi:hypothetical protein